MLDLAISIKTDARGIDIIATNRGKELTAPDWPRDCECQVVAFHPSEKTCEVVSTAALSDDIARALVALNSVGTFQREQPNWYRRLAYYAAGVSPANVLLSDP